MLNRLVFGAVTSAAIGVFGPASAAEAERAPIADSSSYAREVRRLIDERKKSADYEGEGRVMTRFTIRRSGELVQVAIDPGPTDPAIERAAISMIRAASRDFPPFPAAMSQDEQTYRLPVAFSK